MIGARDFTFYFAGMHCGGDKCGVQKPKAVSKSSIKEQRRRAIKKPSF
jgi:hypothetical protein